MKLIIDTDPGIDDAMALGIALTWPNAEILALTAVNGNISCEQACKNTLKIRKVFGREDVPVYKGADNPVFAQERHSATHWHGMDGLLEVTNGIKFDETKVEKMHAVNCIIDLASKHKGEISLIAIGPLTNLALAVKLKPELPKLLKEVVILGGNYTGLGNHTPSAEFNFVADPLAAHIVLDEYTCPIYIVPWETVLDCPFTKTFADEYGSKDNDRSRFFKLINDAHKAKHGCPFDHGADVFAVCVALEREKVVLEKFHTFATVEPFGAKTHGMMVVERRNKSCRHFNSNNNVFIVTKLDVKEVEKMLLHSVI
eukprot:Seg3190.3 transcript_id=Seg3190.3/GoldUCD/mRNA.D3Y31 product="Inosine-uridine preferring nucleoside hydrolase" protein_id=Seg3190.3/GoldUCD/D3Y31